MYLQTPEGPVELSHTATVVRYVENEIDSVATGTFEQIIKAFDIKKDEKNIYYKLAKFNDVPYEFVEERHFGCLCKKRGGLKITEGIYCNSYLNNQFKRYLKDKEGWGKHEDFLLLVRFYLYFMEATQISPQSKFFCEWTNQFFKEDTWQRVSDLNDFKNVSGIYALILDEYAKCYIGQAVDIKKRVLEHWRKDSFVTQGIDLFRAKDTTRIYTIPSHSDKLDQNEYNYVGAIPNEYRLNCLQGGSIAFHEKTGTSLFFDFKNEEERLEYLEKMEIKMQNFFEEKPPKYLL